MIGLLVAAAIVPEVHGRSDDTESGGPLRLDEAAERLALAVKAQWEREEQRQHVHDPFPLPVRWHPVAGRLIDRWANIRRAPPGSSPGALDLAGSLDQIVDVYRRVPPGRLVVLGKAGSGKTLTVTHRMGRIRTILTWRCLTARSHDLRALVLLLPVADQGNPRP